VLWLNFENQCIKRWWVWSIYIELWVRFWFKKPIISFRIIEEIEIISLCSQIEVLLKENYFEKSFLINASFIYQSNSFSLCSLINSDFVVYINLSSSSSYSTQLRLNYSVELSWEESTKLDQVEFNSQLNSINSTSWFKLNDMFKHFTYLK